MRAVISIAFLLCLWTGAACAEEAEIGMVKTLKGHGYVVSGGQRSPAAVGTKIHRDETLETDEDGAMGVTFVDNSTLSLGPKSQITMSRFVFDPQRNGFAFVASIAKGTFMFASGLIAKLSPDSVAVQTPVGTIGIRGTRFLVQIEQ